MSKNRMKRPVSCHGSSGFSLVELMVALAIAALLAGLAYPSFAQTIRHTRRAEAWTNLQQIQWAQARHRAKHPSYASLTELGWQPHSPTPHYLISVRHHTHSGYALHAQALGSQAADLNCSHLQIELEGLTLSRTSGPTEDLKNGELENQRCWGY